MCAIPHSQTQVDGQLVLRATWHDSPTCMQWLVHSCYMRAIPHSHTWVDRQHVLRAHGTSQQDNADKNKKIPTTKFAHNNEWIHTRMACSACAWHNATIGRKVKINDVHINTFMDPQTRGWLRVRLAWRNKITRICELWRCACWGCNAMTYIATPCNTLQYNTAHCNARHYTATHYSTL